MERDINGRFVETDGWTGWFRICLAAMLIFNILMIPASLLNGVPAVSLFYLLKAFSLLGLIAVKRWGFFLYIASSVLTTLGNLAVLESVFTQTMGSLLGLIGFTFVTLVPVIVIAAIRIGAASQTGMYIFRKEIEYGKQS